MPKIREKFPNTKIRVAGLQSARKAKDPENCVTQEDLEEMKDTGLKFGLELSAAEADTPEKLKAINKLINDSFFDAISKTQKQANADSCCTIA